MRTARTGAAGGHAPLASRPPLPRQVAVVAVALMVAAAGTARAALGGGGQDAAMPARRHARSGRS